jgi:hypothetical protein
VFITDLAGETLALENALPAIEFFLDFPVFLGIFDPGDVVESAGGMGVIISSPP